MHDRHLDDLIIDNSKAGKKKGKSLLTILALLVVMLVVAIVLTGKLLDDPQNGATPIEEINPEMIAPELKLQDPTQKKEEPKPPKKDEEPTLSLVNILEGEPLQEVLPKSTQTPVSNEIHVEKKPKKILRVPITDEYEQTASASRDAEQNVDTPTPKEKYYVQVGSFSKTPSTRFLSVIKNSGFNYTIGKPSRKGIKKLLIGPYPSRNVAKKSLSVIKDRINKSAFIIQR